MKGYCGECDNFIEFHKGTVIQEKTETEVKVYLVCPRCEEKELLTTVKKEV